MKHTGVRSRSSRGRLRLPAVIAPACSLLIILWTGTLMAQPVEIAVIGDYGVGYYELVPSDSGEARVARVIKGWDPDFIMTVGDNNYFNGEAETIDANIGQFYSDYIYPYQGTYGAGALRNRFFPALGNHDFLTPGAAPYLAYFVLPGNERYYNYRHGPVEIFALNSDFSEPHGVTGNSTQGQWLQARLASSTAPWKLVYFHVPPYSSGGVHGSHPYMQWPFAQWGASAVISGHDHIYERILTNGIPYFVNGLGGFSTYPISPDPVAGSQIRFNQFFGAMRIEATYTNITFEFVTRLNTVVDTYKIPEPPAGFPTFTQYPGSQTVRPGTNVVFEVATGGDAPLSYRWQRNGVSIPDETNSVLTLTNVQSAQAGFYSVLVSNLVATVRSATARLTVLTEPTILQHPASQTVHGGTNVLLFVAAEGSGSLAYQWRHNGTNLPGATNAFLLLTNVHLAQNGQYRVQISDELGSVFSLPAVLVVLVRPVLLLQPLSQSVAEGGTVVFSASVAPATLPLSYRWVVGSRVLTNLVQNELSSFFTLTNVQSSNAGVYRLAVTNLAGVSTPSFSGPAILTVLADNDRDDLPDTWEAAHGLSSSDPADAQLDTDDDGMTNWQEYTAGTDPLDTASSLKIEILRLHPESPPMVKLSFMALSNRTYAIERRVSPSDGPWRRVVDIVAGPTNRMAEVTTPSDLPNSLQQVYRAVTPRLP